MRGLKWLLIIGIICSGLTLYFWANKTKLNRILPRGAVTVTVAPIKTIHYTPAIEAIGSVTAYESVTITVNVTEYVKKISFKEGEFIKKGTTLVILNSAEEHAQMASLKSRYDESVAHFKRSKKLMSKNFQAQSAHDVRQANMRSAKAQLDVINAKINDRIIKAPFDGVLGIRKISEGALLKPGDAVVTLDMVKPIKVDFTLAERYLSKIYQKQTFSAKTTAFPNITFNGEIKLIATRIDKQTRSIVVRGQLSNKKELLKPGMLLFIKIKTKSKKVFVIPEQALMSQANSRFVYIVQKNKAVKIPISIIERHQGNIYVEAKLPLNSQLVIDGAFKLNPGMAVEVKNVAQ